MKEIDLKILQLEMTERKAEGKKKIGKSRPQYIKIAILDPEGKTETYLLNRAMTLQGTQKVKALRAPLPVKKLILELNLEPGFYLLEIYFVESSFADFCIVLFDEKEIGCFGVPNNRMNSNNRSRNLHCNVFPFICPLPGNHKLQIMTVGQMGGNIRPQNNGIDLKQIALRPHTFEPTEHSLLAEHPGRICLDIWGWSSPIYYQRDCREGVDFTYFKRRVIDESYKWGANLLETGPGKEGNKVVMSWDERHPIKKPDGYLYEKDSKWSNQEFINLNQYTHFRDMLIHWDVCQPPLAQPIPDKSIDWLVSDVIQPGEGNGKKKLKARRAAIKVLQKIGFDFSDSLKERYDKLLDGFECEWWKLELTQFTKNMWAYNPGLYLISTSANDYLFPDSERYDNYLPPNLIMGTQSAVHYYETPETVNSIKMAGHDDKNPLRLYGEVDLHTSYGKQYLGYQIDCRTNKAPREIWGEYWSQYGGGSYPDWVIKQCHDFLRPRAKNPDDTHETGMWWCLEAENICPDETRRYVYAVSQDPIRCAVATNLRTTGKGGVLDKQRKSLPHILHSAAWRARSSYSYNTSFIQNNYLRVYLYPDKDKTVLLYDLERLAHFDSDSLSLSLTDNLAKTLTSGKISDYHQNIEFLEPAGYKAVLKSDTLVSISGSELKESRLFTLISDTPYLSLKIERNISGKSLDVGTSIGCEGYNQLIIKGKVYDSDKSESFKVLPRQFRLRDRRGLKPDLVIFIQEAQKVKTLEWFPSKEIILKSPEIKKEIIQLNFVIPTTLYNQEELKILLKTLSEQEESLYIKEGSASIDNKYPIPLVKVIKIKEARRDPYLVKEFGWWLFRGAQPSLSEKNTDYLKIYLQARGKVTLQSYGFIEGAVKPGFGCQYILMFKDIGSTTSTSSCIVKVLGVTPFIFAPRIKFKKKVKQVKLNGASWHYFDEDLVFLPNRPGTYRIEVSYEGKEVPPHLTRTFALVESTQWRDNEFTFQAMLPPWTKKLPKNLKFTAVVALAGYKCRNVYPGKILRSIENKVLVEFEIDKAKEITLFLE